MDDVLGALSSDDELENKNPNEDKNTEARAERSFAFSAKIKASGDSVGVETDARDENLSKENSKPEGTVFK